MNSIPKKSTSSLKAKLECYADALGLASAESRKKLFHTIVLLGVSSLGGTLLPACGEEKAPTPTGVNFNVPSPEKQTGKSIPEQMSCRDYCATIFSDKQNNAPGSWGCWEARENGQPISINETVNANNPSNNALQADQQTASTATETTSGSTVQFTCAKRDGYIIDRTGPGNGYGVCDEFGLECDHTKDEYGFTADCGFGFDEGENFTTKCVVPKGRDM